MIKQIRDMKDVKEVSDVIIGKLVMGDIAYVSLAVDHQDGTISNCFFSPATHVKKANQQFMSVEDYAKIIILLLTHPKISDLAYDEKENVIQAIFHCPEMQQLRREEDVEYER